MPDGYTTMMQDNLAYYYQALGLSPAGAAQAANQQAPSGAADQAMLQANDKSAVARPARFSPVPFPNMIMSRGYVPKKATTPPGTQIVPSQTKVVTLG